MEIQNSVGYLLNLSAKLMKRGLDQKLECHEITTSQWAVLKALDIKGELPPAKIAEELNSDRATTGSVVDRLLEKKLVEKNLDSNDRRSYRISLSTKGKDLVPVIENLADAVNQEALKGLSPIEIESLQQVLNKIIGNLSKKE